MSAMQRNKGKRWEQEVARDMRELFPDVKRGWQARFGHDEADVTGSPFWIECKHHALVNIHAAIRQAMSDTDGKPVLVVSKSDRCEPLATMRWQDFRELLTKAYPREKDAQQTA